MADKALSEIELALICRQFTSEGIVILQEIAAGKNVRAAKKAKRLLANHGLPEQPPAKPTHLKPT